MVDQTPVDRAEDPFSIFKSRWPPIFLVLFTGIFFKNHPFLKYKGFHLTFAKKKGEVTMESPLESLLLGS